MRGSSKAPVAIFKPIDEEQFAPNNPRDFTGSFGDATFRPGVLSGEATIREVAAYLLDHDHFSGVPYTELVAVAHDSFKASSQLYQQSSASSGSSSQSGIYTYSNPVLA
jgi:hypothetical protein